MKKNKFFLTISMLSAVFLLCSGCIANDAATPSQTQNNLFLSNWFAPQENIEKQPPQDPYMVRTTEGANALDLETPLRCDVNWETQQMILTLPYIKSAFKLERNGQNDTLPRFEVDGFTFDMMPAEQAMVRLTKEA